MIKTYRKKPVMIKAVLFTYPMSQDLIDFAGDSLGNCSKHRHPSAKAELEIKTLEDGKNMKVTHIADEGDFIIQGVKGEFYACKPDIFRMTYEEVT